MKLPDWLYSDRPTQHMRYTRWGSATRTKIVVGRCRFRGMWPFWTLGIGPLCISTGSFDGVEAGTDGVANPRVRRMWVLRNGRAFGLTIGGE